MRLLWLSSILVLGSVLIGPSSLHAEDWPMFGRDQTRNAISPEKNPPTVWHFKGMPKKIVDDKVVEQYTDAKNIAWTAKLGSITVGGPVVAGGLVWVGTNNNHPRDPALKGDASVLLCFRESDGKFLYQYISPRLTGPKWNIHNDWPRTSFPCTPTVEGDRMWFNTNRCEAVCLDICPLRKDGSPPRTVWKVDMTQELGVFPRGVPMGPGPAMSIPAPYGDYLYVVTGNGVAEDGKTVPAPEAPSLVCLHKDTGKVIWRDSSPGKNILQGQWASPLVLDIGGRSQVIAPQGDGWVRSFDARTGKLLWKFDTNPKDAVWRLGGAGTRNAVVATPVYHGGRVYLGNGLEPENYEGVGWFYCIDPTKEGDISAELEGEPGKGKPNPNSGVVWRVGGLVPKELKQKLAPREFYFGRTVSTCVVQDGLVYAVEIGGHLQCLDARTGHKYWEHDLRGPAFGSPCWVDGKVYLGNEHGDVFIFAHGKEKKEPKILYLEDPIRTQPVFANGVLYLATDTTLFAIQEKK